MKSRLVMLVLAACLMVSAATGFMGTVGFSDGPDGFDGLVGFSDGYGMSDGPD